MNFNDHSRIPAALAIALVVGALLISGAYAQSAVAANGNAASPTASGAKNAKVADLAFLAGNWEGTTGNDKINQQCTMTDPAMMLCMFWMLDGKGTQMVEIYTLRDTPAGIEERVRFMSPELNEEAGSKGLTMKLASYSPREFIFENASGGTYPKRSTLTRVGDDAFNSRIELIDAKGQTSLIQAQWKKTQ